MSMSPAAIERRSIRCVRRLAVPGPLDQIRVPGNRTAQRKGGRARQRVCGPRTSGGEGAGGIEARRPDGRARRPGRTLFSGDGSGAARRAADPASADQPLERPSRLEVASARHFSTIQNKSGERNAFPQRRQPLIEILRREFGVCRRCLAPGLTSLFVLAGRLERVAQVQQGLRKIRFSRNCRLVAFRRRSFVAG